MAALLAFCGFVLVGALAVSVVLLVRRLLLTAAATTGLLALRARSYSIGERGEVARLRLALRGEVEAVRRCLAVARAQDWPVGDTPGLLRRLDAAAAAVDARLQALAVEPRPDVRAADLPGVREQVDTLVRAAAGLRAGLSRGGAAFARSDVDAIAADCAIEAQALWARPAPPA